VSRAARKVVPIGAASEATARAVAREAKRPYLYEELGHIRRMLEDVRSEYKVGCDGQADDRLLDVFTALRSIEISFYGVEPPQPDAR
jgi:hypothetical protein